MARFQLARHHGGQCPACSLVSGSSICQRPVARLCSTFLVSARCSLAAADQDLVTPLMRVRMVCFGLHAQGESGHVQMQSWPLRLRVPAQVMARTHAAALKATLCGMPHFATPGTYVMWNIDNVTCGRHPRRSKAEACQRTYLFFYPSDLRQQKHMLIAQVQQSSNALQQSRYCTRPPSSTQAPSSPALRRWPQQLLSKSHALPT